MLLPKLTVLGQTTKTLDDWKGLNCRASIAEEELADSSGLSHGSIAIGASETALNIFLLDKLKNFHMTYPGIRLKLYNHSTPEARNFPFGR